MALFCNPRKSRFPLAAHWTRPRQVLGTRGLGRRNVKVFRFRLVMLRRTCHILVPLTKYIHALSSRISWTVFGKPRTICEWCGWVQHQAKLPPSPINSTMPSSSASLSQASRWTEKAALLCNIPSQAGQCKCFPTQCTHAILYLNVYSFQLLLEILEYQFLHR
jgi:hypothetical protein